MGSSSTNRRGMSATAVRHWLGMYVLVLTSVVGAFLLMAPNRLLPLESPDRVAATEIIVPFLLGQVAAVYRFYTSDQHNHGRIVPIPAAFVMAPPIIVSCILVVEFVLMAVGGMTRDASLIPSPESFRGIITFCVALLNASTVFVITRYFVGEKPASADKGEA